METTSLNINLISAEYGRQYRKRRNAKHSPPVTPGDIEK